MHDKSNHSNPASGDRIEPARIDLSHVSAHREPVPPLRTASRRVAVSLVLVILLVVAAGVIFVLPDWTQQASRQDQVG